LTSVKIREVMGEISVPIIEALSMDEPPKYILVAIQCVVLWLGIVGICYS